MKYSARQLTASQVSRMNSAWRWNEPLLMGIKDKYNVDIPEKVITQVKNLENKVSKIIALSYDNFADKFISMAAPDSTCIILDGRDMKTGFPYLYVYAPELDEAIMQMEEKEKQLGNVKRLRSFLAKSYNLNATDELLDFIQYDLPADIPFVTYFDGSRTRVANLANMEDAQIYGSTEDDIFAVEYRLGNERVITIFYPEMDYKSIFAKKLVNRLEIPKELAMQISENLPHDVYYSVYEIVYNNFDNYATKMASILKVKEGDIVHDILQGDIPVITGSYSKKLALDLDDEFPSAILVKNKITLYLPADYGDVDEE